MRKLIFKLVLIVSLLFVFSRAAKAQLIPAFEMPFYFEDAKGNLDTIIIGLDERAGYEQLDSIFGEVALNEPFDSIFDVRLRTINFSRGDFTKRDIRNAVELNGCAGKLANDNAQFFLINAKYPPVKMYYNANKLKDVLCWPKGALLLPNNGNYHFIHPYEITELEEEYYRCLSTTDTVLIDFDQIYTEANPLGGIPTEINDGTTKPLLFFQFVFGYDNFDFLGLDITFCEDSIVSTNSIKQENIKLFPMPVKERLFLSGLLNNQIGAVLKIYTTNGQVVYVNEINNATEILQLNYIPNGQYFITLTNGEKLIFTDKFIKTDL